MFHLLAPLLASLVGACGEMPEDGVEQRSGAIDEVIVTVERGPCTTCAEIAGQIATAEAQARARAMAEAEERARQLRIVNEQRIRNCIAAKNRAVAACSNGAHTAAAGAAAQRAQCMLTNPCRVGGSGTRRNTCIAQGAIQCQDNLNSCSATIPFGSTTVEPHIIGQAVGACYARFGTSVCRDGTVTRACGGTGNFGGMGSTAGLCEDYLRFNCAEPEARALAQASQAVARCMTDAWIAESVCLGHPTMVMH
jgi:hypothetical protein